MLFLKGIWIFNVKVYMVFSSQLIKTVKSLLVPAEEIRLRDWRSASPHSSSASEETEESDCEPLNYPVMSPSLRLSLSLSLSLILTFFRIPLLFPKFCSFYRSLTFTLFLLFPVSIILCQPDFWGFGVKHCKSQVVITWL